MSVKDPSTPFETEQLLAEVEELRHSLRDEKIRHCDELRQFAYAVSHDLREPFRMVKSYTELLELRSEQHTDADRQDFLRYIAEAIARAERLLADLVTYSHQLKPLDQPGTPVDAEGVLSAVLLTMEKPIHDSGAQITQDPLPSVTFNFEQFRYLLQELITNAMKFRGAGAPHIHISASETEQGVTFSVRDQGIGIDPQYHVQIFDVFKRLHGREFPGSGMGLAICKRIVEQRGGAIWVESDGKGSNFRFTLPR
jgi:light-regulated signal transduction histidine kinase (bacteriophytochrome)